MTATTTATAHRAAEDFVQGGYPLPWAFTDDHLEWQRTVRTFCENVVAPGAAERSIERRFDPDLVRATGELGAMGLLASSDLGGGDGDLRMACLAAEELATVDSSLAVTVHVQAISIALLAHLAADRTDLLKAILPDACAGRTFISFGLTEPGGGSDAGNIATSAKRDGSDWVINGAKQFITNSGTPMSRYVILFAATGPAEGRRAPVSAFLVPLDAPGVTVGKAYSKLGWRSSDTHPLFFDDVRVPADALIGDRGLGLPRGAAVPDLGQAAHRRHVHRAGSWLSVRHAAVRARPPLVRRRVGQPPSGRLPGL